VDQEIAMRRKFAVHAICAAIAMLALTATTAQAATETVLYNFPYNAEPFGRLEQDGSGALYGTAGTLRGKGAIYRLEQQDGVWQYKDLFRFKGSNGKLPYAGLIADRTNAIFYGVTELGGANNDGTVFSFAPSAGSWSETVLHDFIGTDGSNPTSPLYRDKTTGTLFGTALLGGANNCGTVFQLTPSGGRWSYSAL
jgi:uncharacterized repeat protein (TIGR03803 family)